MIKLCIILFFNLSVYSTGYFESFDLENILHPVKISQHEAALLALKKSNSISKERHSHSTSSGSSTGDTVHPKSRLSQTLPKIKEATLDINSELSEFIRIWVNIDEQLIIEYLQNPNDNLQLQNFMNHLSAQTSISLNSIYDYISEYLYELALNSPHDPISLERLDSRFQFLKRNELYSMAAKCWIDFEIKKNQMQFENAFNDPLNPKSQLYMETLITEYKNHGASSQDAFEFGNEFKQLKIETILELLGARRKIVFPIKLELEVDKTYLVTGYSKHTRYDVIFKCIEEGSTLSDIPLSLRLNLHNLPNAQKMFKMESVILKIFKREIIRDDQLILFKPIVGQKLTDILLHTTNSIKIEELKKKYQDLPRTFLLATGNRYHNGDVKPDNVVVDETGNLHLVEYGLSYDANPKRLKRQLEKEIKIALAEWDLFLALSKFEISKNLPDNSQAIESAAILMQILSSLGRLEESKKYERFLEKANAWMFQR